MKLVYYYAKLLAKIKYFPHRMLLSMELTTCLTGSSYMLNLAMYLIFNIINENFVYSRSSLNRPNQKLSLSWSLQIPFPPLIIVPFEEMLFI